ncbi:unnamed protein product, partial [Staurois parvus]
KKKKKIKKNIWGPFFFDNEKNLGISITIFHQMKTPNLS